MEEGGIWLWDESARACAAASSAWRRAVSSLGQRDGELGVGLRTHEHVARALVVTVAHQRLRLGDAFLRELQVERCLRDVQYFPSLVAPRTAASDEAIRSAGGGAPAQPQQAAP